MPRQRRRHPTGNATSLPPRHHPAHRHGRHPLPGHSRHPETPTLERIYRRRCLFYLAQTKNIVISTGAAHGLIVSSVAEKPASLPILLPRPYCCLPLPLPVLSYPKQTSSRPKQRTVLSSVAQWRDPCISSLFLYRPTPRLSLWVSPRGLPVLPLGGSRIDSSKGIYPRCIYSRTSR